MKQNQCKNIVQIHHRVDKNVDLVFFLSEILQKEKVHSRNRIIYLIRTQQIKVREVLVEIIIKLMFQDVQKLKAKLNFNLKHHANKVYIQVLKLQGVHRNNL